MKTTSAPKELHRSTRIGWLRASVLGADDGIVSTASLIVGVASSHASHHTILLSGTAGLVAGAMSMAAGEYVSVSSQADTEKADLAMEKKELKSNIEEEQEELAQIYVERGLDLELARKVAAQLMARDALGAHARDELGITEIASAQPIQAALASALSFTLGAALPLTMAMLAPVENPSILVAMASLLSLIVLGALAARAGGASALRGALRVAFWGSLAMLVTAGTGLLFKASI